MNVKLLRKIDANRSILKALAIILLIASIGFGLYGGYKYMNPPSQTKVIETTSNGQLSVETRAKLTTDTQLYDKGKVFKNSPIYLFDKMTPPVVISSVTHPRYEINKDALHKIYVRITAKKNNRMYYSQKYILKRRSISTINKPIHTTQTTIPISKLKQRARAIRNLYNKQGIISVKIVSEVEYNSSGRTMKASLPVTFGRNTYTLGKGKISTQRQFSRTKTQKVHHPMDAAIIHWLVAVVLIGLSGASVYGVRKSDSNRDKWEYDWIKYKEDWISYGTLPEQPEVTTVVEVETLEDLVDTAIDSNKRAFYDEEEDIGFVLSEDILYYVSRDGVSDVRDIIDRE